MADNDFKVKNGLQTNGDIIANGTLYLTVGSDAEGDLYQRAANGALVRIPKGANSTALSINSTAGYEYILHSTISSYSIGADEINPSMMNTAAVFESMQFQQLRVNTNSSGISAGNDKDDLIVENNANAGISILTPNTEYGEIAFGDEQDADVGRINYQHSTNVMRLYVAGVVNLTLTSTAATFANRINSQVGLNAYEDTEGQAIQLRGTDSNIAGYVGVVVGTTNPANNKIRINSTGTGSEAGVTIRTNGIDTAHFSDSLNQFNNPVLVENDGYTSLTVQGNTTTGANVVIGDGTTTVAFSYIASSAERRDHVGGTEVFRANTTRTTTYVNAAFNDEVLLRDTTTTGTGGARIRSNNFTTAGYIGAIEGTGTGNGNTVVTLESLGTDTEGALLLKAGGSNQAFMAGNGSTQIGAVTDHNRIWGTAHVKAGNSQVNGASLNSNETTLVIEGATAGISIFANNGDSSIGGGGPTNGHPSFKMVTPLANAEFNLNDYSGLMQWRINNSTYLGANSTGINTFVIHEQTHFANAVNRSAMHYLGELDLSGAGSAAFTDFAHLEPGGNAAYDAYMLIGTGLISSADSDTLGMQVGNTTAYFGGTNYQNVIMYSNNAAVALERNTARHYIIPNSDTTFAQGNVAGEELSFDCLITGVNYGVSEVRIVTRASYSNPGSNACIAHSSTDYSQAEGVHRVRFLYNTGTMESGTIRLYGLKSEDFNQGV